jgi:predicted ATPase
VSRPVSVGAPRGQMLGGVLPDDRSRDNLPADLSTFVGRESAVAETRRVLDVARLPTLTGSGGVGKTRLALRLAGSARVDYRDGAWLVDLGPVADPALVPMIVARVLGLTEGTDAPIATRLVEFVRSRCLLLVLDKCEHLVQACADLAALLLSTGSDLRILATSREPLGVSGEVTWPVASARRRRETSCLPNSSSRRL